MKSTFFFIVLFIGLFSSCDPNACNSVSIPNSDRSDPSFTLHIRGPGLENLDISSETAPESSLLTLYAGRQYIFTLIGHDGGGISRTWAQIPSDDRMHIISMPSTATIRDVSIFSRIIENDIPEDEAKTCGTLTLKLRTQEIDEVFSSEGHIGFQVYDYNNPPWHNSKGVSLDLQYTNDIGNVGFLEF